MAPRKWFLNETFFDDIDTAEKAYWLGLLYADGYNNVKGNQITLTLKDIDTETVKGLARAVGSNSPVVYRTGGGFGCKSRYASFYINSAHVCMALERHGCGQCKSNHIRFPFWLKRCFWSHFVRGYFDGDGGLSTQVFGRRTTYRANIVSNPRFIDDLNGVLEQELGRKYYVLKYYKHRYTTQLRVEGNKQTTFFLTWLYKDATVSMKRKRDLFEALLKYKPTVCDREAYAYRVSDGSFVGRFPSRLEAGRVLGVHCTSVTRCCLGRVKTAGGYRFTNTPTHRPSDALPIP